MLTGRMELVTLVRLQAMVQDLRALLRTTYRKPDHQREQLRLQLEAMLEVVKREE